MTRGVARLRGSLAGARAVGSHPVFARIESSAVESNPRPKRRGSHTQAEIMSGVDIHDASQLTRPRGWTGRQGGRVASRRRGFSLMYT